MIGIFEMVLIESELANIRKILVSVQLILSACNDTITTDSVDANEDEIYWRIDHNQQIQQIDKIAKLLNNNLCSGPRCFYDNNDL